MDLNWSFFRLSWGAVGPQIKATFVPLQTQYIGVINCCLASGISKVWKLHFPKECRFFHKKTDENVVTI